MLRKSTAALRRIGLIGLGEQMVENLLPALAMQMGGVVVGVCDIDRSKVDNLPPLIGQTAKRYTDYKAMLNDPNLGIDVVIVAASPQLHYEISQLALKNGICPWVEKPPCETSGQLVDLVRLSQELGLTTGVGVNYQWAPAIKKFRGFLKTQRFGRPLRARIFHPADKPKEPIWGLNSVVRSFNLAQTIHSAHLATTLGGEGISRIRAFCDDRPLENRFLWVEASVQFNDGLIIDVVATNNAPHFAHNIKVWTDTGSLLEVDALSNVSVETPVHVQKSNCQQCGPLPTCFMDKKTKTTLFQSPVKAHTRGFFEQFEAFLSAVASKAPFESDFASLLPTYEILDQIEGSGSIEDRPTDSPPSRRRTTVWNQFAKAILNTLMFW